MFENWIKAQMDSYQNSLDLSTITQSDLLMENQYHNTEIISTAAEELTEIDDYESSEIVEQYINNYQKWKNTKLVTASLLCLVAGGFSGFYLSDLSQFSHAALTVGNSEKNDAFYDAVNHATKAANLTQTAKTSGEWQKVSQSWINAISLLNSLPENHPQYSLANEKIQEYERNLNYSRKNSENQQNDFRIAVNHATNAANLTQTASSSKEWETVIENWQNAIALMKTVKPDSPNYFVAQQKTIEYQRNVNYAFSVIKQHYPDSHLISEAI